MSVISKIIECPECSGSGWNSGPCEFCDASGLIYQYELSKLVENEDSEDNEW